MANDYLLTEAIRLIKSGQRDAARVILEPYLKNNPNNIQAWMWEAELFPDNDDKIRVLEDCLRSNPGNPQATQALNFLKNRSGKPAPTSPFSTSPFTTNETKPASPFTTSPFSDEPVKKPAPPPFSDSPTTKPSVSPFSTSPFLDESDSSSAANLQGVSALPSPPPFESSQPVQAPALERKTQSKHSKRNDILIIVGVVIFFALLAGGYIAGGFYLDGQINQAFVGQKCKDVIQRSSFISLYPQGIFSSVFTGYDQYTQCQLKLDTEQTVKTKDWGTAFELTQEYLSAYPQGAFAADMNQQSIDILSGWAKELIADKNYSSGIEKLKTLIKNYPALPTAESVRNEILQTYLVWGKEFVEQKRYPESEEKLKSALAYFQTDSTRAEKINADLVDVYIGWGDSQVEIGNMDNALKYYQEASNVSNGATDTTLLIAKAYLYQAITIADKNDFNRALSKVQEVESTTQADNVNAEVKSARETILEKYSESDSSQAAEQIAAVIPLICSGQRPELPIFGIDKEKTRFGLLATVVTQLPTGLSAATPGQLHYVACAEETEKKVESCPYSGKTLYRLRYEWNITLYDIKTGEVFNSQLIEGSDPPECKTKESFSKGLNEKKSYGNKPTIDQVATWLQELGIAK